MTPQFVGFDGETSVNLQCLSCAGENVGYVVMLSRLNAIGAKIESFYWADDLACWVDDQNYEPLKGITFQPGEAFWLDGDSEKQILRSSGQVSKTDAIIQLCDGATMTGNFTPIDIDLQDVVCEGKNVGYTVMLSKLDSIGVKTQSYYWADDLACWVDDQNYEYVSGVKIAAGEGVWIDGNNSEQYVIFPGVEL